MYTPTNGEKTEIFGRVGRSVSGLWERAHKSIAIQDTIMALVQLRIGCSPSIMLTVQYNGEYAKQGEEWPPVEAFSDATEESQPSTAPPQGKNEASSSSCRPAAPTRSTHSAQEVSLQSQHCTPAQNVDLHAVALWRHGQWV